MDAPNRVYALQRPLMPSCMSLLYPELVLGLCFIAWKVYRWHQERLENPRSLPLPPGPKGFLFLGNALQIKKDPWLRFSEWHNYGDVIGLTVLGRKVAVLNTWEAADELFNKRGAIYSNRPPRILTTKYGGWDFSLISFPYGETFLRQRRFLSQSIGAGPVKSMYPLITKNARALAGHLIGGSKDIQSLLRLAGTANIISMSYGFTVTLDNPKWVEHLDSVLQGLSGLGTPGAHPVDIFPILAHLPSWVWGRKLARSLRVLKAAAYSLGVEPYNLVKAQVKSGIAPPSMVASLIESNTGEDGEIKYERDIYGVAAISVLAGVDTTVSTTNTFIIAMMIYPEIQRTVQKELDAVLSGDRLPLFEDQDSTPYLVAALKECLRWKSVAPLGLPHSSNRNDEYNGKFIPKDTMLLANIWKFGQDPVEYPLPTEFNPERFLVSEQGKWNLKQDFLDPEDFAFGFGRRVCPGRYFATASVWMNMATLLAVFNISCPFDEHGKPIMPDLEYIQDGVAHRPKPYRCVLEPRSETLVKLLSKQDV